jgi:hypothetical protein
MLFIQQNQGEMQAQKLFTYHGLHFNSLQPHVTGVGCKIAKRGDVNNPTRS